MIRAQCPFEQSQMGDEQLFDFEPVGVAQRCDYARDDLPEVVGVVRSSIPPFGHRIIARRQSESIMNNEMACNRCFGLRPGNYCLRQRGIAQIFPLIAVHERAGRHRRYAGRTHLARIIFAACRAPRLHVRKPLHSGIEEALKIADIALGDSVIEQVVTDHGIEIGIGARGDKARPCDDLVCRHARLQRDAREQHPGRRCRRHWKICKPGFGIGIAGGTWRIEGRFALDQ